MNLFAKVELQALLWQSIESLGIVLIWKLILGDDLLVFCSRGWSYCQVFILLSSRRLWWDALIHVIFRYFGVQVLLGLLLWWPTQLLMPYFIWWLILEKGAYWLRALSSKIWSCAPLPWLFFVYLLLLLKAKKVVFHLFSRKLLSWILCCKVLLAWCQYTSSSTSMRW